MADISPHVREFLRDFYDAFSEGKVYETQSFYEKGWRDMSKRNFAATPWPSPREVAPVVKDDKAFLVLYRLLFYRHILAALNTSERPATFAQYTEAWNAYRDFFAFALESSPSGHGAAAAEGSAKDAKDNLLVPPVWIYDIFGDLVYLYQQFHDLRAAAASGQRKIELGSVDEASVAASWQLGDVLGLLHSAAERSGVQAVLAGGANPSGFRQLTGYFSLVCLSRFYTKLGDYGAALDALKPLRIFAADGTTFARIPKAHIFVQYYASFALLMARKYEDAFRVLNRTLATFQRMQGVFAEREGGAGGPGLIQKNADKMLALLALCIAVLPNASIGSAEEPLRRPLRERFNDALERIGGGDAKEVEDIFDKAAPGYFPWNTAAAEAAAAEPTPAEAAAAEAGEGPAGVDTPASLFTFHLTQLQKDIAQRTGGFGGLRSFLRLYTSIDLPKLAAGSAMSQEDVRSALLSFKIKAWATAAAGGAASAEADTRSSAAATAAASDNLHFYCVNDTVAVEESRAAFNMNAFFIRNIEQVARVARELTGPAPSAAAAGGAGAHRGGPGAAGGHGPGHHGGAGGAGGSHWGRPGGGAAGQQHRGPAGGAGAPRGANPWNRK